MTLSGRSADELELVAIRWACAASTERARAARAAADRRRYRRLRVRLALVVFGPSAVAAFAHVI